PDLLVYEGAEPDALWRAEAAARIENIRKGDLELEITDKNGVPIKDANVHVAMKKHAFSFGTAINDDFLNADATKDSPDSVKYRAKVAELFNTAVFENSMKGHHAYNPQKLARVDKEIQWLQSLGIKVRGHNLIWQEWKWSPA